MRAPWLALSMLPITACASTSDEVMERTFDPCRPLAVVVSGEASGAELVAIDRARALWAAVLGPSVMESDPGAEGQSELVIRFENAAAAFHGIYLDEVGEIVINRRFADEPSRAVAIAHELGHAFGLWHVDATVQASVMNPGNLTLIPAPGDHEDLRALWPSCAAR